MHFISKQFFTSNHILRCIAVYIGYMTWIALNQSICSHVWLEVPLSFYNIPKEITLQSPEKIKVQILAKKHKLIALDQSLLAAHIDAKNFIIGPQNVILNEDLLLLPSGFKLVNYEPQNIVVQAEAAVSMEN